jgi:Asp-tRNA(Asn)/Glu-tRNA(Gln) amidotransferase B subunit
VRDLDAGGHVEQQTMLWTRTSAGAAARSKEEATTIGISRRIRRSSSPEHIEQIRRVLPEFPRARRERYRREYEV